MFAKFCGSKRAKLFAFNAFHEDDKICPSAFLWVFPFAEAVDFWNLKPAVGLFGVVV